MITTFLLFCLKLLILSTYWYPFAGLYFYTDVMVIIFPFIDIAALWGNLYRFSFILQKLYDVYLFLAIMSSSNYSSEFEAHVYNHMFAQGWLLTLCFLSILDSLEYIIVTLRTSWYPTFWIPWNLLEPLDILPFESLETS